MWVPRAIAESVARCLSLYWRHIRSWKEEYGSAKEMYGFSKFRFARNVFVVGLHMLWEPFEDLTFREFLCSLKER